MAAGVLLLNHQKFTGVVGLSVQQVEQAGSDPECIFTGAIVLFDLISFKRSMCFGNLCRAHFLALRIVEATCWIYRETRLCISESDNVTSPKDFHFIANK